MPEKIVVKLKDVANEIDGGFRDSQVYLNTITGDFVTLFYDTCFDDEEELAEEIDNSKDYIPLPDNFDIDGYRIMMNFAKTLSDDSKREKLFYSLNGQHPFRRFKDALYYFDLEKDYFAFQYSQYLDIAREWCKDNDIPYREDTN